MPPSHYTVDVLRVANGGDAVAKLPDGKTVFIRGALPGERVEIDIVEQKKNFARGKIRRVIVTSPDRVEPGCPHATRCGGCDFWHTTYTHELKLKVEAARDTFARISKLEIPKHRVHHAKSTTGWRTRGTFTTDSRSRNLGFVERATRHVIDVEVCKVMSDEMNAALSEIRAIPNAHGGRIFIETDGRGGVIVEANHADNTWVSGTVHGVVGAGGDQDVLASQSHHIAAEGFTVPAGRFRQGNTVMNHVLVSRVADLLSGHPRVLELFCGMGNFTTAYAGECAEVLATDMDAAAIETLDILAARMNLPIKTATYNLEMELPDFEADAVLLDPPRTGAAFAASQLKAQDFKTAVYVSCDVATLARDSATLVSNGFQLSSIEFVDMFPRTAHIETIAVFTAA